MSIALLISRCFLHPALLLPTLVGPLAVALLVDLILYIIVGIRVFSNSTVPSRSAEDHKDLISSRVKEGLAVIVALAVTYVAFYFALDASIGYIAQAMFAFCCIILAFILTYVYVFSKAEARGFWMSCTPFGSQSSSESTIESAFGTEYYFGNKQRHGPTEKTRSFGLGHQSALFRPDSVPMSQIERNRLETDKKQQTGHSNNVFDDLDTVNYDY